MHLYSLDTYVGSMQKKSIHLASLQPLSNTFRPKGSNVAAFIIAIANMPDRLCPQPRQGVFQGDHLFPTFHYHLKPGFYRPATLPSKCGPVTFGNLATSAFTPIQQFGTPLSAVGLETLLLQHPLGPIWANHVHFGFPLLSEPEWVSVPP